MDYNRTDGKGYPSQLRYVLPCSETQAKIENEQVGPRVPEPVLLIVRERESSSNGCHVEFHEIIIYCMYSVDRIFSLCVLLCFVIRATSKN
jgi:hypothetical protein